MPGLARAAQATARLGIIAPVVQERTLGLQQCALDVPLVATTKGAAIRAAEIAASAQVTATQASTSPAAVLEATLALLQAAQPVRPGHTLLAVANFSTELVCHALDTLRLVTIVTVVAEPVLEHQQCARHAPTGTFLAVAKSARVIALAAQQSQATVHLAITWMAVVAPALERPHHARHATPLENISVVAQEHPQELVQHAWASPQLASTVLAAVAPFQALPQCARRVLPDHTTAGAASLHLEAAQIALHLASIIRLAPGQIQDSRSPVLLTVLQDSTTLGAVDSTMGLARCAPVGISPIR